MQLATTSGISVFPVLVDGRQGLQFALRLDASDRSERPTRGIIFADQNRLETMLGGWLVRLLDSSTDERLEFEFGALVQGKLVKPMRLEAALQASGKHYFTWCTPRVDAQPAEVGGFFKARAERKAAPPRPAAPSDRPPAMQEEAPF